MTKRAILRTLSDLKTQPKDYSIRTGSGGVLYGVYRYILLLKQEDRTKLSAHLNVVEWRMNSAIESNITQVNTNKPDE